MSGIVERYEELKLGRPAGANVHKAGRIYALAAGGEILASTDLVAIANSSHLPEREVELRGLADPIQVAVVPWA